MSTRAQEPAAGFHNLTRKQLIGTLTGLLLALLLAALDQTIVGTAMPRIIAQLNGFDRYPWMTTAYLLTSTISVPIFAKLSDIKRTQMVFPGRVNSVRAGVGAVRRLGRDDLDSATA